MQISFFSRKLYLLCLFLLYALVGIGQGHIEAFDEKWETAQTYLADDQLPMLWKTLTDIEQLVPDKQSAQYGKVTYLFGEYWYVKEKWAKAKNYLDKAIPLLEKDTSESLLLAEVYLVAGFAAEGMKDEDQSLLYYQKALALKQQILGLVHPRVASIYFNIGETYQTKLDLTKSDSAFQKGVAILQTIAPEYNVELADYYEELGYNQSLKDDFNAAIKYLKKAFLLKEKEHGKTDNSLIYSYKYLGKIYRSAEYFGEAINYYNKALSILKAQEKREIFQEAMLHYHIGRSYFKLKSYEKAFAYFDKAIKIDTSSHFILFDTYRLKGKVASERGNIAEANKYFDKALKGFENKVKNSEEYLLETFKLLVAHQLKIGNYTTALSNAQIALNKGVIIFKNQPNRFFELYLLLGKCYLALEDSVKASKYFSKANTINGGTISKEFANLKQLKNKVTLNLEYVDLYKRQYMANDLPALLKTDTLLTTTIQLVDYITTTYQEKSTKENFIEEYHKVFRQAIEVKYLLANATKNDAYLKTAFTLTEKSKNLILLETLNRVDALELAAIPDAIIKKEQSLRVDVTYLENRRFEENQQSIIDEASISLLNEQIFELKEQYQTLLKQIEVTYPDYFKLKFKPTFITITDIQQRILSEEQTIIEYFLSDDLIYVFLIKKHDFKVLTLPKKKNLITKINQFRESIYSYRPANIDSQQVLNKALIATTNQLGLELYELLILPFKKELTKKIIIVADGALGYLPFDALITKLPNRPNQSSTPTYLMTNHIISYAHSVNWLSGLYKKEKIVFTENFIGLAPVFKSTDNGEAIADFRLGLGPLKHNQEEIINIKNSIGGKVLTGVAATQQAFLAYLKQGQTLHLATHGKSNDEQGDYSYLAFAESTDTTHNRFLYVKDLFNLRIPAELVVLSACETGLGEIKRGEGIVGIGRGFSYAGAKSMVTTLWRVSDNSTANFMPLFYAYLKDGFPKDEALWMAKKEFIATYRSTGHPFFWSGYVAYGNMDPIVFQHYNWSSSFLAGILLIIGLNLFLFFYFFRNLR